LHKIEKLDLKLHTWSRSINI